MGFGPSPEEAATEEPTLQEVAELSLEELDKVFQDEDPSFLSQVDGIGKDTNLSLSDIDLDNLDEALYQETQFWRNSSGWRYILFRIFPGTPLTSLRIKKAKVFLRFKIQSLLDGLKGYIFFLATEGRKKIQSAAKEVLLLSLSKIKSFTLTFARLPWKTKLIGLLAIGMLAGTAALIIKIKFSGGLVPSEKGLYIKSFDEVATSVETYDPEKDVEPFYDNLRSAPNLIFFEKIVVNLKPTKGSGPNPMGAFEFFLEGLSPEVIIEVKAKEVLLRDIAQRTIEQFSFEALESTEGKKDLCDQLERSLSKNLTSGKLKAVRLKTIVLKP